MKEILKNEIESKIKEVYGEIDDTGCYNNGEWMSLQRLYWLVCDAIDENDYLFESEE